MGLLDAPAPSYASPRVTTWHRKVKDALVDTVVLVLGDSTSAGATRWSRLVCDNIAQQWPNHTVVWAPWDDTSKTYPAGSRVTVQTGTNGRTITVFNCSVSGQTVGYAVTNFGTIITGIGTPDVIIWNYGHNSPQDLDNYRALTHQAVNEFSSTYPNAAHYVTAQNPRDVSDWPVDYAPDRLRQRANYEYGMAEGHGVIDVDQAFIDYGNYQADLLLADGLHPNDGGGSPLWARLVWDAIRPRSRRTPTASPASRPARIWVPAKGFDALDGSPTYQTSPFGFGVWALDADVEESLCAVVDFPSDWMLCNIDVHWTTATAPLVSARTPAVLLSHQYISGRSATGGTNTIGTWTNNAAGTITTNASTTANRQNVFTLGNRMSFSGRPLAIKIARKAADALDNLPQDFLFIGAMIQRMF